jgi:hypothetical protein
MHRVPLTISLKKKLRMTCHPQAAVFGRPGQEKPLRTGISDAGTPVRAEKLYGTVHGGRPRLPGHGPPLEVSGENQAVEISASNGILNPEDIPLLMHGEEILTERKPVSIHWESFRFED